MKKYVRGFIVIAVILGLLGLAVACASSDKSDQVDQMNKLIDKANVNVDKFNSLQKEVDDLWTKINALGSEPTDYQQAQTYLSDIEKKETDQKSELNAAIKAYQDGQKLDIKADFKTYLGKLELSAKKRLEVFNSDDQIIKITRELLNKGIAGTVMQADIDTYTAESNRINAESDQVQKQADDLKVEADKFHQEKNLGGTEE